MKKKLIPYTISLGLLAAAATGLTGCLDKGLEELPAFEKLMQTLEENDDVQEVYHNVALPG